MARPVVGAPFLVMIGVVTCLGALMVRAGTKSDAGGRGSRVRGSRFLRARVATSLMIMAPLAAHVIVRVSRERRMTKWRMLGALAAGAAAFAPSVVLAHAVGRLFVALRG